MTAIAGVATHGTASPVARPSAGAELPVIVFANGLYAAKARDSVAIHNRDYMLGLQECGATVFALDMGERGPFSTVLKLARLSALLGSAYAWPNLGIGVARTLVACHRLLVPVVRVARQLKRRTGGPAPAAAAGPGVPVDADTARINAMLLRPHVPAQRGVTRVACVLTGYDLMFAPRWCGVWKAAIASQLRRHFPDLREITWFVHVVSETTRVAPALVAGSDACDEVWAPSDFNLEALRRSGLRTPHLHKVPETIDTDAFREDVPAAPMAGRRGFCFLTLSQYLPDQLQVTPGRQSVTDLARLWNHARKSTDVLIRAFLEEFGADEDVSLAIKSTHDVERLTAALRRIVTTLGFDERRMAQIVPLGGWTDAADVPRVYAGADAFVLVSRGEGWGRPLSEAMALGKPVIGTNFGGNTEFMTPDNSYLVDYSLVPVAAVIGPKFSSLGEWAEPSLPHLRQTLRAVFTDRREAALRGQRAAASCRSSYGRQSIGRIMLERIKTRTGTSGDEAVADSFFSGKTSSSHPRAR